MEDTYSVKVANEVPIKLVKTTSRSFTPSILRLFNALPVETNKQKKPSKLLLQKTTNNGFIFSPEVEGNYIEEELLGLIEEIAKEVGLSPETLEKSTIINLIK